MQRPTPFSICQRLLRTGPEFFLPASVNGPNQALTRYFHRTVLAGKVLSCSRTVFDRYGVLSTRYVHHNIAFDMTIQLSHYAVRSTRNRPASIYYYLKRSPLQYLGHKIRLAAPRIDCPSQKGPKVTATLGWRTRRHSIRLAALRIDGRSHNGPKATLGWRKSPLILIVGRF